MFDGHVTRGWFLYADRFVPGFLLFLFALFFFFFFIWCTSQKAIGQPYPSLYQFLWWQGHMTLFYLSLRSNCTLLFLIITIIIDIIFLQYSGTAELNGAECAKWEHSFTIYDKVNTYTLYTTKTRPLKPLRYEMMGYDTLLASYYDHYILDYHEFEAWKFNYSVFDIPTGMELIVLQPKQLI